MKPEDYKELPAGDLCERINSAKKSRNALILGHNYQIGEVQEISDFLGDSLRLAQLAAETDADLIVFCGVRFMAESAKILSASKRVLLPSLAAGCPMADMVTADELKELRAKLPGVPVVCYINTSAAVKAASDICCTSSNAVQVVESLPADEVIFVPDKNLAAYVQTQTDKRITPWDGYCYVHDLFAAEDVELARAEHPGVKLVVHPECPPEVIEMSDFVASTDGMMKLGAQQGELIVGTELGLVERMNREYAGKRFYPLSGSAVCRSMKRIDLALVAWALENEQYEISVPEEIRIGAERALSRMLDLSK